MLRGKHCLHLRCWYARLLKKKPVAAGSSIYFTSSHLGCILNVPGIMIYLRNTTQYNNFSYISFKIIPSCNYTTLPATVKVMETFLEAILWKPFQLFRRILNDASTVIKIAVPSMPISVEEIAKNSMGPSQESMGVAPVLSHSLLRNAWTEPTGVLEHCREGETTLSFSIFRVVSFWTHP